MGKPNKRDKSKQPEKKKQSKPKPAKIDSQKHQSKVHSSINSQNHDTNDRVETSICCLCKNQGSYMLVECDECDRWFCFNCANLIEISDGDPWSCDECLSKQLQNEEETNRTFQESHSGERATETNQSNAKQPRLEDIVEDEIENGKHQRSSANLTRTRANPLSSRISYSEGSMIQKGCEVPVDVHASHSPIETNFGVVPVDNRQLSSTARSSQMNASNMFDGIRSKSMPVSDPLHRQQSVNSNRQEVRPQRLSGVILEDTIEVDQKSSRTISTTKTSSSRQTQIEQQRLQEELELQEKFDEARIAYKLEALALQESRERRFLKERFKMMNRGSDIEGGSSAGSSISKCSKPSNRSMDRNVSNRTSITNHSEFVSSWVEDQNKTTPSDVRQQRFEDKIDAFNFNYSVSIDPEERKEIQQRLAGQNQCEIRVNPTSVFEENSNMNAIPINTSKSVKGTQRMGVNQDFNQDQVNISQPHVNQGSLNQRVKQVRVSQQSDWNNQSEYSVPPNRTTLKTQGYQSGERQPSFIPSMTISQPNCHSIPVNQQNNRSTSSNQGNIASADPLNQCQQPLGSFHQPVRRLTADQIAARHVITKKLPLFYGNPADWPEFFDKYTNTTAACGFDNTENLDRLFESLKGKARAIVRSQLTIPACVPSIMHTLEEKFGRKELVVKAQLKSIRDEPPIEADKLEALSDFGYKVQSVCQQIQRQGMQFYLYNPELVQEIVDKLPHQTKIDWARFSINIQHVTLVTLSDWLAKLSHSLNRITTPEVIVPDKKNEGKENSKGPYVSAHRNGESNRKGEDKVKCEVCTKSCKTVEECQKFKGLSVEERWKFFYNHKRICRGCLKVHGRKCPTPKECGVKGCTYRHHAMLHNDQKHSKVDPKVTNQTPSESNKPRSDRNLNAHGGGQAILYKIIPVVLRHRGKTVNTCAYLDDGSGLTILEKGLADELGLRGTPESLCLRWTSGTVRHEQDSERVVLEVSGVGEGQHVYQLRNARTVKSLDLPKQTIDKQALTNSYPYLDKVKFEDFSAEPRILIGLDNVKLGISRESIEGGWNEPIVSKTLLGWVVHGPNGEQSNILGLHTQFHVMSIGCYQCQSQIERDDELHRQVEEFFSLENFGTRALTSSTESTEVQRAREIMEGTIMRKTNRFEIGLLWRYDDIEFPNNYQMAMKRLACQDKRMQANPALMENINNQVKNFVTKGYARKLTPEEVRVKDPRTWYLPVFHHLDPKKPDKVRLVWDAAAKCGGMSLNSMLLSGPDNLVALTDILRRFRERAVAIGGDIEEMYHQIEVRNQDQNSQRFLWRNGDSNAEPDVYVMKVVTFGATCSPSIAQFVKNRNATEFESEYPEAASAIKSNHYVDDWLDCTHTVNETIQLAKDVTFVHKQGGFKLRKFISNSTEVLKAMGEDGNSNLKDLNVTTMSTQRILGMWWNPQTDCFTYSLKYTKLNEEVLLGLRAPTKREILKTLMSIYDPLGLISHFMVYLKILLQEVWKTDIAWDEQLPENLYVMWNKWVRLLPRVEEVHIPRLYSIKISPGTAKSIELHTFVDASENAYCAVCYLRITDEEGVECVLVGAKTKVVPIKPILTIPRKELLAAVLGTRLARSIGDSLTIHIDKRQFWSDSRDVLCWIRSVNRKYRQFVAFRVGEILEMSTEAEWRFVPGKLNVADEGTKWTKIPRFTHDSLWFCGPRFLWNEPNSWPQDQSSGVTTNEEIHVHFAQVQIDPPTKIVPSRFSNWSRMVNAQALANRYLGKLLAKIRNNPQNGPLTSDEIKKAENMLYKLAQFDCYYEEVTTLKDNQEKYGSKSYVKKSSPLYKCSPYIAEDGLLRVRGRIDKIQGVKFDTKRPIIMPNKHRITELIVNCYHRMFLHRNNETVINELRQKFHIPKIRVVLRHVKSKCQHCKNSRAKPEVPEMGDLPLARLSPRFRVFSYTGVDYFGPMYVTVNRGVQKRWGVLFTCLTVRAVHIEIAPSLTADTCILCVRNFVNIRGTPCEFWSDNGTNFTAADKELRREFENIDLEKLQLTFTKSYSTWKFNPPASPHMSGSWERLIRSVKENLKEVMPTRTPKPELLESYLKEVANIINSRPLTYLEIESSEDEVLTPNHFIHGSSNGIMAPGEFPYEEKSLTKSWRRSQELTNMFWRRWIKEYLPTITRRSKWFTAVKPVEIGDVVLLVDEKNSRNSYPRGKVVDVKPDKFGMVRQATVRTVDVVRDKNGKLDQRVSLLTRPVAKIAVLDVTGGEQKHVVTPVSEQAKKRYNLRERTTSISVGSEVNVGNMVNKVRSIGSPITKGPNEEENVTDGNTKLPNDKITTLEKSQRRDQAILVCKVNITNE